MYNKGGLHDSRDYLSYWIVIPNDCARIQPAGGGRATLVDYGGASIVPATTDPVAEAVDAQGRAVVDGPIAERPGRRSADRRVTCSIVCIARLFRCRARPLIKIVLTQAKAEQAVAYLSVINFGELIYITEREQGAFAARRVIAATDQLPITIIEADRRLTFAAAHIKAHYRLSYADAFAVALAQQTQATLLTGDPEFRAVEHLITNEWLPQDVRG